MTIAISSVPIWDPETKKKIVIEVSEIQLEAIVTDTLACPQAVDALKKYEDLCARSHAQGKTSSPERPNEFSHFWELVKRHNAVWPGTVGSQIANAVSKRIFSKGAA